MTEFTPARLAALRAVAELLSGSTFASTLDDYSNVGRVAFYPIPDELMGSRKRVAAFFENLPETVLALTAALEAKTAEAAQWEAACTSQDEALTMQINEAVEWGRERERAEADAHRRAVRVEAALERVKALHRKALAVFSWSEGGVRYEEPCESCNGAPGVHPCDCWADEQTEYVCAECDRDKGKNRDSSWPCATIQAIERTRTS